MVARMLVAVLTSSLLVSSIAARESASAGASPKSDAWVIGVDDRLAIWVWEQAELTRSVKVRPDGRISLPYVQDVDVAGKTPAEVRDALKQALAAFVKEPIFVTVAVEEINSFPVYFLGEVKTPGEKKFARPMRVLQAVAAAGGPTEYAKKQITIIREEFGIERRIEIDYKKLLEGAPGQENLYLKPGDTLIVR